MKNLIIEGLTGAGKSSVVTELKKLLPENAWQIIYEEDTLGELLSELNDKKTTNYQKCYRLRNVLERLDKSSNRSFLLERFHPSYYAMMPEWNLYAEMDAKLAADNFVMILLHYNENLFEERAMRRADIKNKDGTDPAIEYWGGLENALKVCKQSQDRRIECLGLSKIKHLKIDTSAMRWEKYATDIARHVI